MDIKELFEHGVRSGHWIRNNLLIQRLLERIEKGSKINSGTKEELEDLEIVFNTNLWGYKVVLVQPRLSRQKLISGDQPSNAETLLITLDERTRATEAELEIWCGE